MLEAQPELVARHFSEAGLTEKALGYWLLAGRRAAARSANVEAIAHLRAGLASVHDLPADISTFAMGAVAATGARRPAHRNERLRFQRSGG